MTSFRSDVFFQSFSSFEDQEDLLLKRSRESDLKKEQDLIWFFSHRNKVVRESTVFPCTKEEEEEEGERKEEKDDDVTTCCCYFKYYC